MPSRPYFAGELREASVLHELAAALDSSDESDQEVAEDLVFMAAEPLPGDGNACGASAFEFLSGFDGNKEQCSAHAAVQKRWK